MTRMGGLGRALGVEPSPVCELFNSALFFISLLFCVVVVAVVVVVVLAGPSASLGMLAGVIEGEEEDR